MSLFYVCLNVSRIHNSSNIQAIINNDCRTFSLPSLAKDHFESVSPKLVQQTTKVAQSPLAKTTLKFLIRVLHFLFFFWDFFPTYYMALLGPTRLFRPTRLFGTLEKVGKASPKKNKKCTGLIRNFRVVFAKGL